MRARCCLEGDRSCADDDELLALAFVISEVLWWCWGADCRLSVLWLWFCRPPGSAGAESTDRF